MVSSFVMSQVLSGSEKSMKTIKHLLKTKRQCGNLHCVFSKPVSYCKNDYQILRTKALMSVVHPQSRS